MQPEKHANIQWKTTQINIWQISSIKKCSKHIVNRKEKYVYIPIRFENLN